MYYTIMQPFFLATMEHNTSGGGGEPPFNDNDDNVEQGSNYGSAIRPALIIHETHIMTEPHYSL
jgi:hypothetical protein